MHRQPPMTSSDETTADLTVMISGGFALAYAAVLPDFERETGLKVRTLSGASQGQGPRTIGTSSRTARASTW